MINKISLPKAAKSFLLLKISLLYLAYLGLPAIVLAENPHRQAGSIAGTVTYFGDVPKSKIRDDGGLQRDLLSVHRRSHGLGSVLVYLDRDQGDDRTPANARRLTTPTSKPAVIDQIEHMFRPHLIAIQDGQSVKFTNSDAANHNVRASAFEAENEFNVYTGARTNYVHKFAAGRRLLPIALSCDLHPWMRGWIFVFRHPYFAVTDEQGKFRIKAVPPGEHRVRFWQPDVGFRKTLTVDVLPEQTSKLELKITADGLSIR